MQEQMQSQSKNMFGAFPFPGMPGAKAPEARSSIDVSRVDLGTSRRSSLSDHAYRTNYSTSSRESDEDWLWLDQQSREDSGIADDIKSVAEAYAGRAGATTQPANADAPRRAADRGASAEEIEQKILARMGDWVKTTDPVSGREYWANPRTCQVFNHFMGFYHGCF
jgi:hypothetical protein